MFLDAILSFFYNGLLGSEPVQSYFELGKSTLLLTPFVIFKAESYGGGDGPRDDFVTVVNGEQYGFRKASGMYDGAERPSIRSSADYCYAYFQYQKYLSSGDIKQALGKLSDEEKILVCEAMPLAELVTIKDDLELPPAYTLQQLTNGHPTGNAKRSKLNKRLEKIIERIAALDPEAITKNAEDLSHQSGRQSVMEWGLDIEEAAGKFLNDSLKEITLNGFAQTNKIKEPSQELETLLKSKTSKFKKAFIKAGYTFIMDVIVRKNMNDDIRLMSDAARMNIAMDILSTMEEAAKSDRKAITARQNGMRSKQSIIDKLYQTLDVYSDALSAHSGRIVRDEAKDYLKGDQDLPENSLKAKYAHVQMEMKSRIASRSHALRQTLHVLELEYGAYQVMIGQQDAPQERMEYLLKEQIPTYRRQLMLAQSIRDNAAAIDMDGLSANLRKLTGQKLRDAVAREMVDNVANGIAGVIESFETLAKEETLAITKAQTLMIADQRPIALLEAPKQEEKQAVLLPNQLDQD